MAGDVATSSETPRRLFGFAITAAKIVSMFDDAQIPSVLWGPLAGHFYGAPYGDLPDFVVPDHLIQCTLGSFPRAFIYGNRHVHTRPDDIHAVIYLYTKSHLLWRLPDFELGPPAADDRYLTLASDDRLPATVPNAPRGPWPSGPWPYHLRPVKIPTAACIIETAIILCCRDYNADNNDYFDQWRGDLIDAVVYMRENVNDEDLLPHFRAHWWDRSMKSLIELREKLLERNELPAPPDQEISNT
ncbi:hypothetical protein PVAR5_2974 [Paecilomyces variotii No. 5]|uniref:Uncharacterized protein n=1 Tax=Byssochlamys spectabilis (strain No. 5 / NBRC 109023) TaxID=1356009 RepID=V5FBZ5_BYSSN|nr:hypothetical protein PVAR5_2974 [Paecilomyces variotii No. 5]